jgi:hypothetical protein
MKGTKVERRKIEEKNQFRLIYIYIYMEMSQENSLCIYIGGRSWFQWRR